MTKDYKLPNRGPGYWQYNEDHVKALVDKLRSWIEIRRSTLHTASPSLAGLDGLEILIDCAVGMPHFYLDEDCWYSCGLSRDPHYASDGIPGDGTCNDEKKGKCDCNLAAKQMAILSPLVLGFMDIEKPRHEWLTPEVQQWLGEKYIHMLPEEPIDSREEENK